jgi:hypothetical protein
MNHSEASYAVAIAAFEPTPIAFNLWNRTDRFERLAAR